MIKIGANFLFCLSTHAMLHFKHQDRKLQRGRPETLFSTSQRAGFGPRAICFTPLC